MYFGDGAHFNFIANIPYAWQHKENPILLPSKRSQSLSVLGLMNLECKLFSKIIEGSVKSVDIISLLNEFVLTINKKTIVILDNAPTHHSKAFQQKIEEWENLDLFIYSLPPYFPEFNKIEVLWRFIKYKWLLFDPI